MRNKVTGKKIFLILITIAVFIFGSIVTMRLKNYYDVKQINEDFSFTSEIKFSYGRENSKEIILKDMGKDVLLHFLRIDRKFNFLENTYKKDPMYAKTSKYIFEIYYPYNVAGIFEIDKNGEKGNFVGNFHLSENAGVNIIEWYFEEIKGVQP